MLVSLCYSACVQLYGGDGEASLTLNLLEKFVP